MSINKKYILSQTKGDEIDMSLKFDTEEEAQYAAMEMVQATQVQFAAELDEGEIYEAPEPIYYDIVEFMEPSYMNPELQEAYRLKLEEEERQRLIAEENARLAEEQANVDIEEPMIPEEREEELEGEEGELELEEGELEEGLEGELEEDPIENEENNGQGESE